MGDRLAVLLSSCCLATGGLLAACAAGGTSETSASSVDVSPSQPGGETSQLVDNEGGELVLGVLPFLPSRRIDELYGPLVMMMSEELDRPVRLRTASSFLSYSEDLRRFQFDVALVQPFEFVELIDQGYRPIARVERPLSATVVSLTALDGVNDFDGLAEYRIGTPPESSAMSQLVDAEFVAAGRDPAAIDVMTYLTHADCLQALVLDVIDACATATVPLREFEQDFGQQLAIVAQSRPIDAIAYVASPYLDAETEAEVAEFLLGLSRKAAGVEILHALGTTGYVSIEDGDYDTVRELASMGERP